MAAKGFKERVLVPALTEQEFSVREARAVIDAIFSSINDALLRHEPVELPIGSFTVVRNSQKRGWRFGKLTVFRQHQVVFQPSAELELAAAAAPPSPPRPKRKKKLTMSEPIKTNPAQTEPDEAEPSGSEPARAAEIIVAFIRDNVHPGNWSIFFDELRVGAGPSSPAMFKRARPKPHELRSLSEAAQVIAECKPQQMPEDSWDHLYAGLEWFARWTQRVMPNAVWQQAMQEAEKTLVGLA